MKKLFAALLALLMTALPLSADCPCHRKAAPPPPPPTYVYEELGPRLLAGIEIRTSNSEMPGSALALKERYFAEKICEKIPALDNNIYVLYSNYESDYTGSYSYFIGRAISSAEGVPSDLTIKELCPGNYACFDLDGPFPASLISAWTYIWRSNLARAYRTDLEVYPWDFDPASNPKIKLFIGV